MARLKRLGAVVVTDNKLAIKRYQELGYTLVPEPVFNPTVTEEPKTEEKPEGSKDPEGGKQEPEKPEGSKDPEDKFVCSECGKSYKNEGSYKKHMLEKHNIEI